MMEIYRWRQLDRWDNFAIPHLHIAPHLPQVRIGDLLVPRNEGVDRHTWSFDKLCPITIHFGGAISRRKVTEGTDYKLPLLWVRAGDVVLSKIDLKNGAVGVLDDGWDNVVVTTHFKVYVPDLDRLNPRYFRMLLQTSDFKDWLWASRSGADGRTEVKLDIFEDLHIPLPSVQQQHDLVTAFESASANAKQLSAESALISQEGRRAFEDALGIVPPPPLPDRPVFIASFKDVDRWSHEGVLRGIAQPAHAIAKWPLMTLGELIDDLENGWSPQCLDHPAVPGRWGVLKVGAVSFGYYNELENKELPAKLQPRPQYEVKAGDVIISRANVARYVGACGYVESTRPQLMLCDKLFRVVFKANGALNARFLAAVMTLPTVREQIETRLTGTSPTMKNISKPALLGLRFPVPSPSTQLELVEALEKSRKLVGMNLAAAKVLRKTAWMAFESALFDVANQSAHVPAPYAGD